MSVYRKQSLPVQFLHFGVDTGGIIVPILKRSKDHFFKRAAITKVIAAKIKASSHKP